MIGNYVIVTQRKNLNKLKEIYGNTRVEQF